MIVVTCVFILGWILASAIGSVAFFANEPKN